MVGALLAPILGALLAPAAAALPSDPVVNVNKNTGYPTIGAAILDANPNDLVLVRPGEYAETVVVDRPLTICSTVANGNACDGTAANTRIVSASGNGVTIDANSVTIRGFTILASGPQGTTVYGVEVPVTATRTNLVIRDNVIQPNPAAPHTAVPENGIRGRLDGATIQGNQIQGWASAIYFRPYSEDSNVVGNRLETSGTGILAYGTGHTITGNTFSGMTNQGIDVAQLANDPSSLSHGLVLRDNNFAGAPTAIHVRNTVDNTVVDARLNDWGVYSCAGISARIANEGPGSTVLFAKWKGVSGPQAPVRIAGDATKGFCDIPSAIAGATAGATILVEPGTYSGALTINKPLTLCSASAGSEICNGSPATTVIDGTGTFGSAVLIDDNDTTIKGFTIRGGTTLISTLGHHRATIEGNRLQVTPSTLSATHGVRLSLSSASRVIGNTIAGNDYPGSHAIAILNSPNAVVAENDIDRASVGVYLSRTTNALVRANTLSLTPNVQLGGASLGVSAFLGSGASLEDNVIDRAGVGLVVTSSPGVTSLRDEFTGTPIGIRLSSTSGEPQPSGFVLREAELANAQTKLEITGGVASQYVDARYNHWGVYSQSAIRAAIVDNGGNNVDVTCFLESDHTTTICPPTPGFGWNPAAPRIREIVTFSDTSTSGGRPIVSREWDFGDGTTSTDALPTKVYTRSGNFDVKLSIVDSEGFEANITRTIVISNNAPTIPAIANRTVQEREWLAFWIRASDPDNDPLTYTLTPRPSGISFYKGGNNSAFFGWFPSSSQSGVYNLTVSVTDGDLTASAAFVVTVLESNAVPVPRFNPLPVLAVGQLGKFVSTSTDTDGTIVSTTWNFTDGPVLSGKTVERSFPAGGVYGFTLEVTDNLGAKANKTGTVQVDATPPTSTIALAGPGNAPIYSGPVEATVSSTDSHGGAVTRFVKIDGGPATEVTGPVTVTGNGVHTVEYYGVDARGNVEAVKSVQFRIDLAAPTASWVLPKNLGPFTSQVEIDVLAQDHQSGMRRVTFLVDDYEFDTLDVSEGSTFATVDGSGPNFRTTWDASAAGPGLHMLSFIAEDKAGHAVRSDRAVLIVPAAAAPASAFVDLGAGDFLP